MNCRTVKYKNQGSKNVYSKVFLNTEKYALLHNNQRLGSRIILFGVSESYGIGTKREGSEIAFKGVTLNPMQQIRC